MERSSTRGTTLHVIASWCVQSLYHAPTGGLVSSPGLSTIQVLIPCSSHTVKAGMVGEHERGATGYPGHVEEEILFPSSLIACNWLYTVSNKLLNGGKA